MRRPSAVTVATLVALAAARPLAAQSAAAPDAPAVDSIFRDFAGRSTPGCAVGVSRRGQVVQERAFGMAELEHGVANTPETIFEAGSVSKQVTAAAVVLLALDGRLSLDDDVRKHLPELPDYGTRITLRHLLNHTSGLRDWGSIAALGGWPRGTRAYTNDLVLDIARRQQALNYAPGSYWSYTNTGFNLLALIVGRVSGVPLAEFTRTRLFAPLGMTHTSWRDDYTRVVPGRAVAYARAAGDGFRMDMPFESAYGNGGLLTTPADLLRWTANLEGGAVVGGPRFVAEMHRQGTLTSGRVVEYASGLFVTHYRGLPEVSHSGSTAGYRAFLSRYPAQGLAVAVLCNAAHANATQLAHRVADAYLDGTPGIAATAAGVRTASSSARAGTVRVETLAGTYRSARDGGVMRLQARDGVLRTATGTPLTAAGPGRFVLGGPDGAVLVFDAAPAAGARTPFRLVAPDGDTLRYEPLPAFAPGAAELAAYAGTYRSDEADHTVTVAVEDGALRVRDRYGRPLATLAPLSPDAFGDERLGVRFLRDAAGAITALSVRESRAWDVRFQRQR